MIVLQSKRTSATSECHIMLDVRNGRRERSSDCKGGGVCVQRPKGLKDDIQSREKEDKKDCGVAIQGN